MSSDSYQALQQNRLVQAIKDAGRTTQEFKAAQRLSSASGQLGYLVETADTWDATETLPTAATVTTTTFELIFTGDGTQDFPIVVPYLDVRVNGTDEAHKVDFIYGSGLFGVIGLIDGDNVLYMSETEYDMAYVENENVQRWTLGFNYEGDVTYYIKASFFSSSDGSLTLTRLT